MINISRSTVSSGLYKFPYQPHVPFSASTPNMRVSLRALLALAVWAGVASAQLGSANTTCANVEGTIYDYELDELSLSGEKFSLEEYRGKVMVIFNSATY